jgi:hypothetical protein
VKILLGNGAPIERHHHVPDAPEHQRRLETRGGKLTTIGGAIFHDIPLDPVNSPYTELKVPDSISALEALQNVKHLWDYHSQGGPTYVVVEDVNTTRGQLVSQLLHDEYNLAQPKGPTALVTNAGLDYASKQLGGTASATAVAVNMALTNDSTAPSATDTTLASEYNHASAGLNRKACTYAHTAGASTYTLTVTFTANGSDVLPFTANKMGVFDATSSGNMPIETLVSPAITWNASGDAGTITETVTV